MPTRGTLARYALAVAVYYGNAIFTDDHTVMARSFKDGPEIHLRGEVILIATGSSPVRPVLFPFDSSGIYDSDTILSWAVCPKHSLWLAQV